MFGAPQLPVFHVQFDVPLSSKCVDDRPECNGNRAADCGQFVAVPSLSKSNCAVLNAVVFELH